MIKNKQKIFLTQKLLRTKLLKQIELLKNKQLPTIQTTSQITGHVFKTST